MTREVRISDVVKALEIAAERLGDIKRSCATLRAWAADGRVTPAGQVLTPAAVDQGIAAWLAKKSCPDGAKRTPPTPLSAKRKHVDENEALAAPSVQAVVESTEPVAKKSNVKDRAKERQEELAKTCELADRRLQEVLQEMNGHMEEILRRASSEALTEWQKAPKECDRRDLYMRLVHSVQCEVQVPEELCAKLMQHQVEGLEWLGSLYVNKLHGILADEMGLGKTIQTISFLLHVKEQHDNLGPHLVVAPKSCLSNWKDEFSRFAPGFAVHVIVGDQAERDAEIERLQRSIAEGKATCCITNYEQVHRNARLSTQEWQIVAVDEGHRLKNPETVLHAAMSKLRCRMRLLLTGTPLQNGLNELWALLHYLLPDLFTCMMDFKAWFARPFKGQAQNEFDIQLDPEQEQQVIARMHALLAPFLLQRLKGEVLEGKLPPRQEMTVRVSLSAWQRAAYADLEKRTITLLGEDESVTSEQVNNALMQLRKIALHPYLFQESWKRDENIFRTSGKLEALDRLLPKLLKFGHKVLIFSQFTTVLNILEDWLTWRKIASVRLDGQVRHEQRAERIEQFNKDPKLSVFLLSARAGGLGLNLQSADTVILFDLDWNPQNDKQAVARVHRVGQQREVRVIRLVSDTAVERHMEERCREKLEMEEKIMGAGMFRRQATAEQRRQALRAVLGLEEAAENAAHQEVTTPEELCRFLARSSEELEVFQAMDATLLKPRRGAAKAAPALVRCGRLMADHEVPEGFTGLRADAD